MQLCVLHIAHHLSPYPLCVLYSHCVVRDDRQRDEDIFPDSPHHLLGLGEEDAANIGHQEAEQQEAGGEGPQQQAAHPEL